MGNHKPQMHIVMTFTNRHTQYTKNVDNKIRQRHAYNCLNRMEYRENLSLVKL